MVTYWREQSSLSHSGTGVRPVGDYGPPADSPYNLGSGAANARPWTDSQTGLSSRPARSLDQLYQEAYGQGFKLTQQDIDSQYGVENYDFPDVFNFPDLPQVFISRISAKAGWIKDCMPFREAKSLIVGGDFMYFNDTAPDRLPEEAVPTYMTSQRSSWRNSLVRFGKGARMERSFFHTPFGRVYYFWMIEQMNNAIMMSMIHSALCAIYYDERPAVRNRARCIRETIASQGRKKSAQSSVQVTFENWGILNREPKKMPEQMNKWTTEFTDISKGRYANRAIFPDGSSLSWQYALEGSYLETGFRMGEIPSLQEMVVKGMRYCESFSSLMGDGRMNHDPAFAERTLGGYFTCSDENYLVRPIEEYKTASLDQEVYDEDSDKKVMFSYQRNVKYLGLWENYDLCDLTNDDQEPSNLSPIGREFWKDCQTYFDAYERSNKTRGIQDVTKILKHRPELWLELGDLLEDDDSDDQSNPPPLPRSRPIPRQRQQQPVEEEQNEGDDERDEDVVLGDELPVSEDDGEDDRAVPSTLRARRKRARGDEVNYNDNEDEDDDSWLSQTDDSTKELVDQINRLPKDTSDRVKKGWQKRSTEKKEPLHTSGAAVLTSAAILHDLFKAIRSLPSTRSNLETALAHMLPTTSSGFNQSWLSVNAKTLWDHQKVDVSWIISPSNHDSTDAIIRKHRLQLLVDSGLSTLDWPSLLFPLSYKHAVLVKVGKDEAGKIVGKSNWNHHVIYESIDNEATSFFNSEERLSWLWHSIECSLLYSLAHDLDGSETPEALKSLQDVVVSSPPHQNLDSSIWEAKLNEIRQDSSVSEISTQWELKDHIKATREFIQQLVDWSSSTPAERLEQWRAYSSKISHSRKVLKQTASSSRVGVTSKQADLLVVSASKKDLVKKAVQKIQDKEGLNVTSYSVAVKDYRTTILPDFRNTYLAIARHILDDLQVQPPAARKFMEDLIVNVELIFGSKLERFNLKKNPSKSSTLAAFYLQQFIPNKRIDGILKKGDPVESLDVDFKLLTELSVPKSFLTDGTQVSVELTEAFKALETNNANRLARMLASVEVIDVHGNTVATTSRSASRHTGDARKFVLSLTVKPEKRNGRTIHSEAIRKQMIKVLVFVLETMDAYPSATGQAFFEAMYKETDIAAEYGPNYRQMYAQTIAIACCVSGSGTPSGLLDANTEDYLKDEADKAYGRFKSADISVLTTGSKNAKRMDFSVGVEDVIRLLKSVRLDDARLFKKFLNHDVPVPVGYIACRPHQTYLMGTMALVIDKDVGATHYMPPEMSGGEDPKDLMMHFTFAMYYKGMLNGGQELMRIYDVYCKGYRGGNSTECWDPLNERHVADYRNKLQNCEYLRSIFLIPCDMHHDHTRTGVRDLTGEFPTSTTPTEQESLATSYNVQNTLCELWGWTTRYCGIDETYATLSAMRPSWNTILAQDYCGKWDGKGTYTRVTKNQGGWGANVYDGCSKHRSGGMLNPETHITVNL